MQQNKLGNLKIPLKFKLANSLISIDDYNYYYNQANSVSLEYYLTFKLKNNSFSITFKDKYNNEYVVEKMISITSKEKNRLIKSNYLNNDKIELSFLLIIEPKFYNFNIFFYFYSQDDEDSIDKSTAIEYKIFNHNEDSFIFSINDLVYFLFLKILN